MSDFLTKNKRTRISKIGSFLLMVSLLSSNFFYLNLPTVSAEEASPEVVPQEDPSGRDTLPPAGIEAPQEEPATLDTSELDGALGAQPGVGEVNEIPSTTPEINLEDTQPAEEASTTIQIPTTTPEESAAPSSGEGSSSPQGEISATSTGEEIPSPAASSTNPFEELTSSSTLEFPDSLDLNPLESLLSPASTTNISTDMAELVIPQNLSGAMIVRYKNKLSGSSLEVSVEGAATSSELTLGELKYSYPDAFPGTDLLYEITKGGIKESIILKEGGHPTQFKYRINLDQFDFVQNSSSTIILYKKWEKDNPLSKLYTLSAPKMIDGTGNESADISFEVEGNILVLTPQAEWLSKATYPIVIDPTIEISVLNIHSHPVAGDIWKVDFLTEGQGDLSIAPADEATVEEDEFVSLFCGEEDRTASAEIREGDVIFYPNWSCDGVATVSHKTLVTGNHHLIFTFQGVTEEAEEVQTAEAFNAALIWTGLAGDGKYSTAGNWSTAKVPSSADSVSFDNTCTNCNVTIDVSTTTVSFTMAATYSGTITQSNDTALTVSGAFSQSAGSFVGGSGTTTIGGNFTLNGGSFNAPTTTVFYGAASNISVFATTTFYNIEFNSNNSAAKTITSANGLEITATTTLTNGLINTGNISALGAVIQSSGFDGGSANLYLNATTPDQYWYLNGGTGPDYFLSGLAQNYNYYITANSTLTSLTLGNNGLFTMTGYNSGTYYLTINTLNQSGGTANMDYAQVTNAFNLTGGTFNSSCTATTTFTSNFTLSGGVFNGCSGTVRFRSSFAITGGTFNAPSTTSFYCPGCGGGRNIDVLGTQAFDNLEFDNAVSTHVIASGDTLVVNGTLTLTGGAINGPGLIKAKGDIVQNSFGGGNVIIDLDNDSLSQTYSFNGGTAPHLRLDSAADVSDSLVFNAPSGITQFTITSDFAGTIPIVNPGNHMITIGGFMKSYSQAAGVFPGGAYTVRFVSDFLLSGTAVFNAPSTTSFYCPGCGGGRNIDVIGTQVFDNVIFDNEISTYNIPAADTLIVNGTLSLTSGDVNGGAIKIRGDVIQGPNFDGGTVLVDLDNDSLSQTWTINGGIGLVLRLDSPADANDSIIFNAAGGFRGVTTTSEFSGIIPFSNPSNHSITIGASGWQQAAGTFNLNSANFIDGGTFNISNSSFIGGTGTTSFASHLIVSGASTFVAASTTEFYNNPTADITLPDFFEFHNFYYNRSGWNTNITNNSNLIVNGLFTFAGGGGKLNGGTIQAKGDIVQAANSGYSNSGGTTIIDFANDSVSQTWTVNGGYSPIMRLDSAADANDRIVFNASGGFGGVRITSNFSGNVLVSNPSNYEIIIGENDWLQEAGIFNLNSANLTTVYNSTFTLSSGSFIGGTATTTFGNSLIVSGSGNYIAASTTHFNSNPTASITVPNLQEFYNFNFNRNGWNTNITDNSTLVINGLLTLTGGGGNLNGGSVSALGNVIVKSNFNGGTTPIIFSGSANQTFDLTGATGVFNQDITVNKSGGEVNLLSALVMDAANQDLTIQSGTLDLNGNNLTVNGSTGKLIVNNGGNLQLAGNETITTLTNYPQLDSGSSVTYDGSGSYSLKDYAYKNLSLTGSGTYTSIPGTLFVAGDLSKSLDSTFVPNGGTVNLNGTNQAITGSFTFNNLTKSVSSAATLVFASSSTQTILGTLALSGAAGGRLSLRSNDTGEQWLLDPQGTRTLQYLDVKDSNNINTTRINAINTYSLNSGNNLGWDFNPTFSQTGYRWYQNTDNLTPSSALSVQNAVAIIPSVSSPVRLRMNVSVSSLLPLSSQDFNLQVSTATSTGWLNVLPRADWWDSSFQNRRKITFNNASSMENLFNFPVLVSLTSSNIDYSKTLDSGADLRFVDSDGTVLNYEIEKWDEAATSTIWVKVPQIDASSNSDFVWMYYNNGAAVSTATTTGVWDSNFAVVYHLSDGSVLSSKDSTRNGNNATQNGTPSAITGQIEGAANFSGSNSYLSAQDIATNGLDYTASVWFKIPQPITGSWNTLLRSSNADHQIIVRGSDNHIGSYSGSFIDSGYSLNGLSAGWHHLGVVASNALNNEKFYIDGALVGTVNGYKSNQPITYYGNYQGGGQQWGGADEVRISTSIARSSSWIKAEYLTGSNQYQTYSAEETVGDTAWRFYDNPSVSSGTALSGLVLSSSTVQGSYQEENPSSLNPFAALAGDFIEFDFSLDPAGILPDTDYYFRLAKADGSELESYDYYPTIRYEEYVAPTYRTVTWDGGAGTANWSDALNWDVDEVPTETDDVIINNSNVTLSATTTVHNFTYGTTTGGSVFAINSGISLITTGTTTLVNGTVNTGIISAQGAVVQSSTFDGGTATVDISGTASQTLTLNGGTGPNIKFSGSSVKTDYLVLTATSSVRGMFLVSGYAGTLNTFGADGYALNIGWGGYTQAAGTFQGGPWTLSLEAYNPAAPFSVTGGTFNAPSTTKLTSVSANRTLTVTAPSGITLENVDISMSTSNNNTLVISNGTVLTVTGNLNLTNGVVNGPGTIAAKGDIYQAAAFAGGNTVIDFANDSVAQTYDLNGGVSLPIRLDSAADAADNIAYNATTTIYGLNVTSGFAGIIPLSNPANRQVNIGIHGYTQAAGTFQGGPWTLSLEAYNPAAPFSVTGGTFNAPSTTKLTSSSVNRTLTVTAPSGITLENVDISMSTSNNNTLAISNGTVVTVKGTLNLINGVVNGPGTMAVWGDVFQAAAFAGGNFIMDFANDAIAQTFTLNGGLAPIIRLDSAADASDSLFFAATSTLYGLNITPSFTGIIPISNPSNLQINIGIGGYTQAAGTFQGGPWTLSLEAYNPAAPFSVIGGTFNAPSTTKFTGVSNFRSVTVTAPSGLTLNNFDSNPGSSNNWINVTSGTNITVTGTLRLISGEFKGPGTILAQGDVVVASTLVNATAPLIFSGSANQTFNLTGATGKYDADITVNKSGGEVTLLSALVMDAANQDLTIQSGTLDLNGNNLTVNGSTGKLIVNNAGNLQLMGNETITALTNYPQLDSGSTVSYDGSGTYAIKDYAYKNLSLLGSGTYTSLPGTLSIAGNFTHTSGIFDPNGGTVNLTGSNQTISGNTTFNNLTKSVTSPDTLTFASSSTQTILGALALSGASGNLLSLRSSEGGKQWLLDPQGTRTLQYLDVKDSNNINTLFINASDGTSINSGNNTGWIFESNAPIAGSASISSVSQTEMAIKISGASDDSSLAALPYVFHNITTGFYFSATSSVFATSTLLSPNTSYSFEVGVYDQYGNSATTTPVSAVTLAAVPSSFSVSQGSANTELNVAWNANNNPAGTEYMVRNETSSTDSGWITGASHVFNGLVCNTSYVFSVKARNADNIETASSASVSGTTSACATNPPVTPPGGGSGGGGGGSPKLADLSIVKTSDRASVKAGQTVSYVLTAHNAGPEAANNVKVTDFLDANLVFVSDSATQGKYNNHSGLWNIGTLNSGGSAALTLTVMVKPGTQSGTISNLATIYSSVNDLALLNNSSNASLNVIGKSSCISLLPPPARFERTLGLNSKGEDVRSLQKFLNDNDFEVAASGPGSKGKETLSFGSMTESALTLFQLEFAPYFTIHGKTGRLDSATRAFINDLLIDPVVWCPNSPETPPLPPLPPEPPLPPVAPEEPPVAEVVPPVIPPNEPETPIIVIPPLPPVSEVIEDLVDQGGKAADVAEDIIKSTVSDAFKAGEKAGGLSLELVIASYNLFKVGEEKLVSLNIDPEASAWVGTITIAPSVMFLQYSLGTQAIIINSVGSLADVWFMMLGFFHGLLTTLGLRSRRRYWGTVYDSKTKQPIDPAIVELIDAESGKVIETSVTDLAGRFGFLDKRGKYFIRARKTHYAFPSQIVTGNTDSIFQNVYHGELIEITEGDDLLAPNIPMDALAFDWNQMEKQKIIKFHPTLEMAIQWVLHFLFWSGFAFVMFNFASHYNLVNGFFVLLYIALIILRRVIPNQKLWGRVVSKNADVSGLLLEISPTQIPQVVVARSITNKAGKFFLKTSPGDYIFRIKKINGAALDTLLESDISVGREGVVNKIVDLG